MKLLLDANISWRIVATLKSHFTDCLHVDTIGLIYPIKDADVWQYALLNNCIIVTNDDNFLNLAHDKGLPPKVILLQNHNQSNNGLAALLIKHMYDIEDLRNSNEYEFLELF